MRKYCLEKEPPEGTYMSQAFDILDDAYGTAPFSDLQAFKTISALEWPGHTTVSAFSDLLKNGYVIRDPSSNIKDFDLSNYSTEGRKRYEKGLVTKDDLEGWYRYGD